MVKVISYEESDIEKLGVEYTVETEIYDVNIKLPNEILSLALNEEQRKWLIKKLTNPKIINLG